MRKLFRPLFIIPIVAALVGIYVASYWLWKHDIVDSVEIQNESSHVVDAVRGGSTVSCDWHVNPGTTGKLRLRRTFLFPCRGEVRFHNADASLGRCSWEAAKQNQPVIVTEIGVSCDTSP